MDAKTQLIRKLKSGKIRVYFERDGVVQSETISGKSELAILLKLQEKGISTRDIRRVEAIRPD